MQKYWNVFWVNLSALVCFLPLCLLFTNVPIQAMAQTVMNEVPVLRGKTLALFNTPDANQGVAVDKEHFYPVTNLRISKYNKKTGEPVLQWAGDPEGPIIHLDSGVIVDGKLYGAHSNFSNWPITSSVEVWDVGTMEHTDTFSFGIQLGSLTWIDRHNDYWWATFANYNVVPRDRQQAYGLTYNTQVVKLDNRFQIIEQWTIPKHLLIRFENMSISGGSWGPDGRLYITGHDRPEIYVMELPDAGSILKHVATVRVPGIEGQGIAWDRTSAEPILWGIRRSTRQVVKIAIPLLTDDPDSRSVGTVNGVDTFLP